MKVKRSGTHNYRCDINRLNCSYDRGFRSRSTNSVPTTELYLCLRFNTTGHVSQL